MNNPLSDLISALQNASRDEIAQILATRLRPATIEGGDARNRELTITTRDVHVTGRWIGEPCYVFLPKPKTTVSETP